MVGQMIHILLKTFCSGILGNRQRYRKTMAVLFKPTTLSNQPHSVMKRTANARQSMHGRPLANLDPHQFAPGRNVASCSFASSTQQNSECVIPYRSLHHVYLFTLNFMKFMYVILFELVFAVIRASTAGAPNCLNTKTQDFVGRVISVEFVGGSNRILFVMSSFNMIQNGQVMPGDAK